MLAEAGRLRRKTCKHDGMYPGNAPPPPPDPREAARQAVKNCAGIQIGIAVLHVITFTMLTLQFAFYKPPAEFHVPPELVSEWRTTALIAATAYVVLFGAWGLLNAWGLGKRSKLARLSSLAFALATVMTCCSAPFGGFLLYLLLRRDVKTRVRSAHGPLEHGADT